MSGKPLVAIVTAGLAKFGKREGLYGRELFQEAAKEAFDRCPNLDPKKDIEATFVGMMAEGFEHQGHTGPTVNAWLGFAPKPAFRTESACASSSAALAFGMYAVMSGAYDVVLCGGIEKMTNRSTPEVTEFLATASDFPFEQWHGITFPGLFAMMATAYMHRYGATEEHLAHVAVKNHYYGARNPKAHMQIEVTLEKVLSSRYVAWPLKLFDCSLITDGASCVVITRPELARKFTDTPVYIIGHGAAQDNIALYDRDDLTTSRAAREAAQKAYRMAGVEPKDIDVAEVHDCFTIAEIIAYEDLGFCGRGEGKDLVAEGQTYVGGKIPVNTSGGLKAKGHPVGATGTGQIYDIYKQLIGEAGPRQVPGAEIGLTHNLGGSAASAMVWILKRGD